MSGAPLRVALLDDFEDWLGRHPAIVALREQVHLEVFTAPLGNEDALARRLADFDAVCLVRERTPFPASLFERLPRLRYVAFTGARNPSCDQDAAARRGIPVSNTPGGPSKRSTAELTWALLTAAGKRLVAADAGLRAGHWRTDAQGRPFGLPDLLEGATLGLLGLGEIGRMVAGYGRAFGMQVIAWSPHLTPARAVEGGAEHVDREVLFAQADYLSIHLVLAPATRGIVGAAELAAMRPGSVLVNTSRAGLVDMPALAAALPTGRPAHAALDVFDREPVAGDDPLRSMLVSPRVTLAPHLGYVNGPVFEAFALGLAEVVRGWMVGAPVRVVNGV